MDINAFKNPELASGLVESIEAFAPKDRTWTLMEVCGTHTVSIARNGIRQLMPSTIKLSSGPGCPVCVTSNHDIDKMIAIARIPGVIVCTFGDMMRVPGSTSSLLSEQAEGADVQIVYSPLDSLEVARQNPDSQVVFLGVGFETTTPLTAMTVKRAKAEGLENFSVFCAHKNMPGALEAIVSDENLNLDALILPGHVSTITGTAPFEFLAREYGIPGVITGFEPLDVLQGIAMLARQKYEGRTEIEIAYKRGVSAKGNKAALASMAEVFHTVPAMWRGLGEIPGSGYAFNEEFSEFDALKRLAPVVEEVREHAGCRCGDVLRSIITPNECPLFRKACSPENPIGPCMVSGEGACAAYYRYY